ncbi:hypothetical protein KDA_34460 [Dictyobacter alpinus]|uniref:Uncharacterized protein n=1 Tax=Dictyobacter alpinus TaxID=2014873 RepID=A0A402B9I2_9CHLR|nr:hypothetical protein KDA_34460 [Dictyobacter alpinus]
MKYCEVDGLIVTSTQHLLENEKALPLTRACLMSFSYFLYMEISHQLSSRCLGWGAEKMSV